MYCNTLLFIKNVLHAWLSQIMIIQGVKPRKNSRGFKGLNISKYYMSLLHS